MAKLNLTQASKAVGISRNTLYNHIDEGKVSVETTQKNGKDIRVIDTSELIRAYGKLKTDKTDKTFNRTFNRTLKRKTAKVFNSKIEHVLRQRISGLEQEISELRKDKEHLQQDKQADRQREGELLNIIKKQQMALLPEQATKKGFFKRLFS